MCSLKVRGSGLTAVEKGIPVMVPENTRATGGNTKADALAGKRRFTPALERLH